MSEEHARALAFERGMLERASTRVVNLGWGIAFFNDRYPLSYDHNTVWAERLDRGTTAGDLVAELDVVQRGMEHRELVVTDETVAARLAAGFQEAGWKGNRHLYMALHRERDRAAEPGLAGEVPWEVYRPARERVWRIEPWATSEEAIRQLVDRREVVAESTHLRHFAARAAGGVASICELYSDGKAAQVEDVYTFAEHRGKGLARAVVLAAVDVALAEGHDFVFLVADAEDWPKDLYAKLGFDPIGRTHVFMRWPEGTHP